MVNSPKVSVVIPVFNKAPYIKEAIDSILNQTFQDFELIIVDDGSNDGGQEVIKSINDSRIRFYQNENNMGTAKIANKLIDLSRGDYIVRLDADDIAVPNRINVQLDYMEKNRDIIVSSGTIKTFGKDNSTWIWPQYHEELWAQVLFRSPLVQSASIIRAEQWRKHGIRYDENSFSIAEDWLIWFRVAKRFKIGNVKETLINCRIGAQNITGDRGSNYYLGRKYLYENMFTELGLPLDYVNVHFLTD